MSTSESFNDEELAALFATETVRDAEAQKVAEQYSVIHNKLWSAVELLEVNTWCGPDPEAYSEEYDELVQTLRLITDAATFQGNRDLLEQHIHITAREMWDSDANVLAQIALAIEEQLYPTDSSIDQRQIKKTLIATLIANGNEIDRWLPLVDFTLNGDLLDTEKDEDMEIMMKAIETQANKSSAPEVQLYRQLLAVFDIDEETANVSDTNELQRIDTLSLAARDFTELAYYRSGKAELSNRHEKLYELFHDYLITDPVIIKRIIELTDAFGEEE